MANIKKIKLPNVTDPYDLFDNGAVRYDRQMSLTDAQKQGVWINIGINAALRYKGTKNTEAELKSITSADIGDVYTVIADDSEWFATEKISGLAKSGAWQKLGPTKLPNPEALTFGQKSYDGSASLEITASDLGAITPQTLVLADIAETGNVNDLIQTSGDLLILDCGKSNTNI